MDGREMMRRIIKNSTENNRMRKEIDQVVRTVLGAIGDPKAKNRGVGVSHTFEAEGLVWCVTRDTSKVAAEVFLKDMGFFFRAAYMRPENAVYSSERGADCIPMNHVGAVHAGVPAFLEKAAETFKGLEMDLQQLLKEITP